MFAGHLVEAKGSTPWQVTAPDEIFAEEIQGFNWLDDLTAVGDLKARKLAQDWTWDWSARFGSGQGPGWTPDVTGRRVIRWVHHALFLLRGQDAEQTKAFYQALAAQTQFLAKRGKSALPGLPRFEAMTGLLYAGLSIEGMETHVEPAVQALTLECQQQIDAQGGIPTRNPEELLEVFTLLTWAQAALEEVGRAPAQEHLEAIVRIAPTLRTLRHADGGLARFHGGGRGLDGRLDQALAASGVKKSQADGLAMGFARLSGGRTSVVVDGGRPPRGLASAHAHASTLAFELTSGRRPLIVNCGSGETFGLDWRRAGRATPSHSTLCLAGHSLARLAPMDRGSLIETLVGGPKDVPFEKSEISDGYRFQGAHDGYVPEFGLTHARTLELSFDGRGLAGEDMLLAMDAESKRSFDKAMDDNALQGIAFDIRLHLHPEVDATLDLGGAAVSMALKSGEIWVFRHDGISSLSLQPSGYLETGRLKPRAAQQIVLSGRALDYATRVRWTLSKAQETAIAVRDLNRDGLAFKD
jgi:uncharacterized heparinase superfamily protein